MVGPLVNQQVVIDPKADAIIGGDGKKIAAWRNLNRAGPTGGERVSADGWVR